MVNAKPILVLIFLLVQLPGCRENQPPKYETVTLAGRPFRVELALTSDQITHGMMGRERVADDEGMLFVFPRAEHRSFWMKNCLVDLDVIFLDGRGRIVAVHTMSVPMPEDKVPPGYPSRWPAQFAIELRGGRAKELGLGAGDQVELPITQLLRWVR